MPCRLTSCLVVGMWAFAPELVLRAADVREASPDGAVSHQAVIKEYCVTCHNARTKSGDLVLDGLAASNVGANPEVWEKVVRKLPHVLAVKTSERSQKGHDVA
jgi:hypothetical protein